MKKELTEERVREIVREEMNAVRLPVQLMKRLPHMPSNPDKNPRTQIES